MLNAALAVIKWKKLYGFYSDDEHELYHRLHDRGQPASERRPAMTRDLAHPRVRRVHPGRTRRGRPLHLDPLPHRRAPVRLRLRRQGRHAHHPDRLAALLRRRHRLAGRRRSGTGVSPAARTTGSDARRDPVAGAWTDEQVAAGRARDDRGRAQYFAARAAAATAGRHSTTQPTPRTRFPAPAAVMGDDNPVAPEARQAPWRGLTASRGL